MRLAVLCCGELSRAQFIYKYIEILDKAECSYDIIYWNRSLEKNNIKCKGRFIPYEEKLDSYKPFVKKISAYLRFSRFVENIIIQEKYDKLIVLTSPMAVTVAKSLFYKYRGKYLFDFRDLTKEYLRIYKILIQKIAYSSQFFVASSYGYLDYFNKNRLKNYCICHNTLSRLNLKKELNLNSKEPIRVTYWGAIRQVEYNKKVCDYFGRDERFVFTYHGEGAYKQLQAYCVQKGYHNISFTGRYTLNQIEKFAGTTDILFNAYDKDFVTKPSLSVKLYDSIEYRIPMLVTEGTFMDRYLRDYSFVKAIDIDNMNSDELFNWYRSLNDKVIVSDLNKIKAIIDADENVFREKIEKFLE